MEFTSQHAATRTDSGDAIDLLWVLPSVVSAAPLFLYWCGMYGPLHLPKFFSGVLGIALGVVLCLSPLLTIYSVGVFIFYLFRRNPVGLFLAGCSLPLFGYASFVVYAVIAHGIPLQP